MDIFPVEAVREVLEQFDIDQAWRHIPPSDEFTEEVILLSPEDHSRVDVNQLIRALTQVIPHNKVWVVTE